MAAEIDYFFIIPVILLGLLPLYSAYITPSEFRLAKIGQFSGGLFSLGLSAAFVPGFLTAHNLIP